MERLKKLVETILCSLKIILKKVDYIEENCCGDTTTTWENIEGDQSTVNLSGFNNDLDIPTSTNILEIVYTLTLEDIEAESWEDDIPALLAIWIENNVTKEDNRVYKFEIIENSIPIEYNFDVRANWESPMWSITINTAEDLKDYLEKGWANGKMGDNNLQNVVVTDFIKEGDRIRANVSTTSTYEDNTRLDFAQTEITHITRLDIADAVHYLNIASNLIKDEAWAEIEIWAANLTVRGAENYSNWFVGYNADEIPFTLMEFLRGEKHILSITT